MVFIASTTEAIVGGISDLKVGVIAIMVAVIVIIVGLIVWKFGVRKTKGSVR